MSKKTEYVRPQLPVFAPRTMQDLIKLCASVFTIYGHMHRAKGTVEGADAANYNERLAEFCEEIIGLKPPTALEKKYGDMRPQGREFDAAYYLADKLKGQPAIVDDDYPEWRHYYEGGVRTFIEALRDNGRIPRSNYPAEMDDTFREILGTPNFSVARIVNIFRQAGANVPNKAEAEQAYFIHWATKLYLEHGADWKKFGDVEISNHVKTIQEKASASTPQAEQQP